MLARIILITLLGPAALIASDARPTSDRPGIDAHAATNACAAIDARAAVHIRLESSVPADGDTVPAPENIRLLFNLPVNPALSHVRLVGANETEWTLPVELGEQPELLVATVPALSSGAYRVEWRVVSSDGHPVSGEFVFHVPSPDRPDSALAVSAGVDGDAAAAADANGAGDPEPDETTVSASEGASQEAGVERFPTMLAVWRGLATSSLMALAGLLTFIVWITPDPSPRTIRLARILAVVAPILLAVHVGAWIRSTTPPGGLDLPWIRALLGSSGSGRAETTRFLCALAALIALWRRHEGTAAILTLTAVGVSGAIGHALAVDRMLSVPARSAHLLAAALWFGGLLVLITSQKDRPEFRSQVRRISAIALASVVAIAFTGLVQSVLLLPSPAGLVTTIYGRAVLAKTAGLIILIAFGATNRRLFMPRLADGHGATALQRSCTVETWVMIAVILLAGFLSYIPIPE